MVVYLTTNLINGKKYVGKDARNQQWYLGSGKYLKAAIKKYGKENFTKEILEECQSIEELNLAEIKWLKKLKCKDSPNFYNATDTLTPSRHGRKLSEEHKKKISESNKGKKLTEKQKLHLSNIRKGVKKGPQTEKTRKKISKALTGRKISDESKVKMSRRKLNKPQYHNRVQIIQIDPHSKDEVRVYDKLTDINEYGFNARSLSNSFKKGRNLYKGFIWIKKI